MQHDTRINLFQSFRVLLNLSYYNGQVNDILWDQEREFDDDGWDNHNEDNNGNEASNDANVDENDVNGCSGHEDSGGNQGGGLEFESNDD